MKPLRKRRKLSSAPRRTTRPRSEQDSAFARWMDASTLTAEQIAAKLRVSSAHLFNLRTRSRLAGRKLAVAIEELSDGMVPVSSW